MPASRHIFRKIDPMFLRSAFMMTACCLGLSACGGTGGSTETFTAFRPLNADGQIATAADAESASSTTINVFNTGYAYAVESTSAGVSAYAALVTPENVTGRPTTGTGIYDTSFKISEVRNTTVSRDVTEAEGDIRLTVNFDKRTLTGKGDGLTIAGTLAPAATDLAGTTTWRGTDGTFRGRVNNVQLVGAFTGKDATSAYAGGLWGFGGVK